jgi:uncharacterized membrane protein
MKPSELSKELRESQSPEMKARRTLIALSLLGVGIGKFVTLYQTGIIKKLPDPPIPIFDSNKVNASDYAYKRFATPDAALMIITYATTAWLASAGREERATKNPLWVKAMFAKILLDCATNVKLGTEEYAENKKLCFYCQSATLISFISLFVAWPEFKKSLGK